MRNLFLTMALATTMVATAATNPFFDYKHWKTPHGTYPFNEIYAEHYMPAFEEDSRRLTLSSTTPLHPLSPILSRRMRNPVNCSL